MKIALQLTQRIKYTWPSDYCAEFINKAVKAGHEVHVVEDEPGIGLEMQGERIHNHIGADDSQRQAVISACDVFVGPPFRLADIARGLGVRVILLKGASIEGEGVTSTATCAGCEQRMEPMVDCLWQDEICMMEITPNDVMAAL